MTKSMASILLREALDPIQKNSKMREAAMQTLNGSVPGRETTCEVPSSEPHSRAVLFQGLKASLFLYCHTEQVSVGSRFLLLIIRLTFIISQRPFSCPVEDCQSSYRRKDHLTRHLLLHQGKLFECPVISCARKFAFQGNMTRHVKEFHEAKSPSGAAVCQKSYVCPEVGCGKVFKYASRLRKHEGSHVKLDTVETFCSEPGCMKHFSNDQCLKAHIDSCHKHIMCEICGTKQLKKNIKRHFRTHEAGGLKGRIKCNFKGCLRSFSTRSNLRGHVNAVHRKLKPFACSITGCSMRFSFKHVRDNHEKSGCHVYTPGDFEDSDEQFRLRPRGGRKRKCQPIDSLMRKRVIPPSQSDSLLDHGSDYLSWLLSTEADN